MPLLEVLHMLPLELPGGGKSAPAEMLNMLILHLRSSCISHWWSCIGCLGSSLHHVVVCWLSRGSSISHCWMLILHLGGSLHHVVVLLLNSRGSSISH